MQDPYVHKGSRGGLLGPNPSAEQHLFEKGPHGFGFTPDLGPTSEWPARCEDWLRFHGWIPAAKS